MRFTTIIMVLASLAAMAATALVAVGNGRQVSGGGDGPSAAAALDGQRLIYVPPRGIPVGGARVVATAGRDGPNDPPTLAVLSPDHVGLTVREQPSLFWYLSKPVKVRLVMTLMKDGDSDPILEADLDGAKSGIQRLDLATRNVKLEQNMQYEISLALRYDPQHKEHDLIASGIIKRVPPTENLVADLQKRPKPIERAVLLARSGVWYDALAILSDQIDTDVADKASRIGRAALLDQIDLRDAASYDRALAQVK